MSLQRQQIVFLSDRLDRDFGRMAIDRIEGDLVFGQFTPGADYPEVAHLFSEYVQAANEQMLSVVGELDGAIGALGLRLHSPGGTDLPAVHDVQIGEGVITFRIQAATGDPRPLDGAPVTCKSASVTHPNVRTA